MTHRNFTVAILFINDGDKREDAYYCQDFESMAEAIKVAKRTLRDNYNLLKPNDSYVFTLYNPQKDEFTDDLFTLSYDGKDYTEQLCVNY